MKTRFFTTTTDHPDGFVARVPNKADLLRGPIVLLVGSADEESRVVAKLADRIVGVIVHVGETVASERIGEFLFRFRVRRDQLRDLRAMVEGLVAALALAHAKHEVAHTIERESERGRDIATTMRAHYNLVTDSLQQKVEQISALNADLRDRVDEQARMEARLRESETDLATTLDSIGDAVLTTDGEGRIRRMNPVAERLTGFMLAEASGRPMVEVLALIDSKNRAPVTARLVADGLGERIDSTPSDSHLVARDGTERIVSHSCAPIRDATGALRGIVVVCRDVTLETQLEERLRHSQRLDAVGQLAGGVAHDFNNVLAGIMGFAELLQRRVSGDATNEKFVSALLQAATRASGLVRQLLAFSQKSETEKRATDLHDVTSDAIDLARRTFDRRIVVETHFEADASTIVAEPNLVQNAILNLMINARDAMPEGGRIFVTSRDVTLDGPTAARTGTGLDAGDYIVLVVADEGEGIPPAIMQRIFEPFFTTKAPGKGTGLGLAAVYGIVREHGGAIAVESQLGKGSTFSLYFPTTGERSRTTTRPEVVRGEGTLLLCDDDTMVRSPLAIAFADLGYVVVEASTGSEAVALIEAAPGRFDLVLLDMNMPVLNGRDAIPAIVRAAPTTPILVASGYLTDADVDELRVRGARAIVRKPFTFAEIAHVVANELSVRAA